MIEEATRSRWGAMMRMRRRERKRVKRMCRMDAGIGAEAIVVILGRRALTFLLLSAIHPASNPSARSRQFCSHRPSVADDGHWRQRLCGLRKKKWKNKKKQVVRIDGYDSAVKKVKKLNCNKT